MATKVLALGILLLAVLAGTANAQDAARRALFALGDARICTGGTDVVWPLDGKLMRWRRRDDKLTEVVVPNLGQVDFGRFVSDCAVTDGDTLELYYGEIYSLPDTRTDFGEAARSIRLVWLSADRHRILIDSWTPDTGDLPPITILADAGVVIWNAESAAPTVERVSDGFKFPVTFKDGGSQVFGIWAAPRVHRIDPVSVVLCYSHPRGTGGEGGCLVVRFGASGVEQRPLQVEPRFINIFGRFGRRFPAERLCGLKAQTLTTDGWLERVDFDCSVENPYSQSFVTYSVANGMITWRRLAPNQICRQRQVNIDGLVVQAQCFRAEAALVAELLFSRESNTYVAQGFEDTSAAEWTLSLIGSAPEQAISSRLVPVTD